MLETSPWSYTCVLITGGTGTFGRAMTRYLLDTYPSLTIRLLSRNEYLQHQMAQACAAPALRFFLGDVRDPDRLARACDGVDLVIHAAALKHVPVGEYDPTEFWKTNVAGTDNVIRACEACGVQQAILLSSDKAVHATNVYGNTKALGERLFIQGNHYTPHGCRFACTRYGNVMAAHGSVVEVWRAALAAGQPLRLTDGGMSRFWMDAAQAVRLVAWVAQHGLRGGVVVPHLPAFTLTDLATAMAPEAYQVHTLGVRPGEKLAEQLMTADELARATWYGPGADVPVYYTIPPQTQWWGDTDVRSMWVTPPGQTQTGAVRQGVPYTSDTWPFRLGVDDLRAKLAALEDGRPC